VVPSMIGRDGSGMLGGSMLYVWLRAALVATAFVAVLEVVLVAAVVSMAVSSVAEAFSLVATAAGFVLLAALPFAGLLYLFERYVWPRLPAAVREPRIEVILGVAVGAPTVVAIVTSLGRLVAAADLEFSAPMAFVVKVAAIAAVAVVALLVVSAVPVFRRVAAAAPRVLRPRVALAALAWIASVTALAVAHHGLFSIHGVGAAGIAGLAGVVMATIAARLTGSSTEVSRRGRWILRCAPVVVLVSAAVCVRDPHTRFVLAGHAPTAGYLADLAGTLADRDGDGAPPRWIGGDDCDEGNARVGPGLREVAGDGIDQDCRGGDARARAPEAPQPYPGCAADPSLGVLVVTIDALRADAIDANTTPNLWTFARTAIVHARAFSPSTATIPSVVSMLTGRPVSDVIAGGNALRAIPSNVTTSRGYTFGTPFPHLLRKAGFTTAAINPFDLFLSGDLKQLGGFDAFNAYPHDYPVHGAKAGLMSAQIVNGILGHARDAADGRRLFLWAHVPDLHAPYPPRGIAHEPSSRRSSDHAGYLRGVRYVDNQLGRLFLELQRSGLDKRFVVVVTSDHGEDLGQRGREGHGPNLFDESIHVPLMLAIPGCAPRVLDAPVSVTALAATLGLVVGVSVPGESLAQGRPYAIAEAPYARDHRRAIISARGKLIVSIRTGGRVLFDLEADPGETTDVYKTAHELRSELERYYQDWLDRP
jgi:arylsulfatase A-like enzyme